MSVCAGPHGTPACVHKVTFDTVSLQFALWVDAVIFVFSLEDEISFQTVYHYFSRLANYRNPADLPLVLVGTQGATHTHTHRHTSGTACLSLCCPPLVYFYHYSHVMISHCTDSSLNLVRLKIWGLQNQGIILSYRQLFLNCVNDT